MIVSERKVQLRKLLTYRDHYYLKAASKRFYSAHAWNEHRLWILAGEVWLAGEIVDRAAAPMLPDLEDNRLATFFRGD